MAKKTSSFDKKTLVEISAICGNQKNPALPKKVQDSITNQIKSILNELSLFCKL